MQRQMLGCTLPEMETITKGEARGTGVCSQGPAEAGETGIRRRPMSDPTPDTELQFASDADRKQYTRVRRDLKHMRETRLHLRSSHGAAGNDLCVIDYAIAADRAECGEILDRATEVWG